MMPQIVSKDMLLNSMKFNVQGVKSLRFFLQRCSSIKSNPGPHHGFNWHLNMSGFVRLLEHWAIETRLTVHYPHPNSRMLVHSLSSSMANLACPHNLYSHDEAMRQTWRTQSLNSSCAQVAIFPHIWKLLSTKTCVGCWGNVSDGASITQFIPFTSQQMLWHTHSSERFSSVSPIWWWFFIFCEPWNLLLVASVLRIYAKPGLWQNGCDHKGIHHRNASVALLPRLATALPNAYMLIFDV